MADDTRLGYNGSALMIVFILAITAYLYFYTKVSHTLLFWAAFILTRPLGATIANSIDKPVADSGLAISDLSASTTLVLAMIACLLIIPQRSGQH